MRVVHERGPRTAEDTPAAVALGYFDGVHLGHAAVIGAAGSAAREGGLRLAVFTFGQNGGPVVKGPCILTMAQKHAQLANLGVQTCYEPNFESFSTLPPEAFFTEMLLGQYNAKAIFCGEDFAFGARRAGNVALLGQLCAAHGVALCVVPTALYEGQPVSSSRIRAALAAGQMQQVNAMLGRPYELCEKVQHGKQLGAKLGFPTINQRFPQNLQPPAFGVYITKTLAGGKAWPSATGWGPRPTVDGGAPSCETFIPGFEGNLYGCEVCVQFYEKIADVQKFPSFQVLAEAVQGWAKAAADFFA